MSETINVRILKDNPSYSISSNGWIVLLVMVLVAIVMYKTTGFTPTSVIVGLGIVVATGIFLALRTAYYK